MLALADNTDLNMDNKQKFSIIAPLILIIIMYSVFQILAVVFEENWRIGWFLSLAIYWLIWCTAFPLLMIGKENIRLLIRPQRINWKIFFLIALPLLLASISRFIPGMEYKKPNMWILLILLTTTFGNGFFEEVMWRGVYMKLFSDSILFRIIWPSIWFALWHYAPGSISPGKNVIGLMIGAGLFGFYLSYLAKKTNTLWWCIITHTLGGIIMVV